jgi:hypothetical protein
VKEVSVDGSPWAQSIDDLPCDGELHEVRWRVRVTNPSANVVIGNIVVVDVTTNLGCNVSVPQLLLPAGASETVYLCTNYMVFPVEGFYFTNDVHVVADLFFTTNMTALCAYDIEGERITVRSQCSSWITCLPLGACRVTGGGRQEAQRTYPTDVRYVTHGGQVGAPVGEKTCVVLPQFQRGNPCIHGRWTHVRHIQGGLRGNFHARVFDTLDCACLDTEVGPGGVYGEGTVVDGRCNPNDRVAGPEPRRAPANKIAFTGVGDYALTKGRRDPRTVLFRVDIEDRSEPGGSHPKGGTPPPDRYRIRIWILTASELAQLRSAGGSDPYLLSFRNAISACNGINVRDGADVPNGAVAFGVRAPDIDDGGELDRGNHQIHPGIKTCDVNNPVGPGVPKK